MTERDWETTKSILHIGDRVLVRITQRKPFGLLVVSEKFSWGVIERIGMEKSGYSLEDFDVGKVVNAVVVGFRDWSSQVELQLPQEP